MCKLCSLEPVIQMYDKQFCKRCFIKYFERKVLKTIAKYKLIDKRDNIGVAVSGGKDSITILYILNKFAKKRPGISITAIAIDEGIHGYRDLSNLEEYCKENNINLKIYSFSQEFNNNLDTLVKKTSKYKPCSICGTFRRYLINQKARELGMTKLATGHNLDDEAQSILINQFRNNIVRSSRLGPKTGVEDNPSFIRRIKPLYFMPEKEVATYAFLKNFPIDYKECPYSSEAYRLHVRDMLNDIEHKYPGTKHSIVNSFMTILPLLKSGHAHTGINSCSVCDEPCSGEICNTCSLLDELKMLDNLRQSN